ncbi:succinate dehydrogenase assembly factor 2 [Stappia sp. F7233]|uniref:FAD assembly factor SdhE n=1 Tax=Stappia albiluteola TaxID=2758565 RepID=A0A839AA86_9HYPH|nr:succinate dehydrogenase assembly factor 2 [Stappia albiluteola]MBA5776560.1 succinate dehydrogenase assembly factor 2 [Stappia albiluteola]
MDAEKTGSAAVDGLDARRKRILFRAQHRGIKEMDILIGGYVNAHIATMPEADLNEIEALMEIPDQDLLSWMTGSREVPARVNTPLYRAIIAFRGAQARS